MPPVYVVDSKACRIDFDHPSPNTLIRALLQQFPGSILSSQQPLKTQKQQQQLWLPGTTLEHVSPESFRRQTPRILRAARQLQAQLHAMQTDPDQPQAPLALGIQDIYVLQPQEHYLFLATSQLCTVNNSATLEVIFPEGIADRYAATQVRHIRSLPASVPMHCATVALAKLLLGLYHEDATLSRVPPSSKLFFMLQRTLHSENENEKKKNANANDEEWPLMWF